MPSLVALLMTDIVGSTRRWNQAEGAMLADLETHDRLVGEAVSGAGGRVFKHTGDGMIAVFDDPVAAAGAAAGIQQAIGSAQWQQPDGLRVRAAVHTGVVYPRDGDMFGTAVNKVARLLGVCPPGAVLVSGATTGLLADRAPEGTVLQPVGPVDLAGFATPDDAHALVGDGQQRVVIAGTATGGRRAEIPSIDDELVGRVDELAAIWDAFGRTRLVTLVGVGGMGKTRLALEVAAGAVDAFDGGVWWIDLAIATSVDAVIPVAMAAVGAREVPGRTAIEALCDRFTGRAALIVVDNCEHVLTAAGEVVKAIRTAAPEVRIVATSREALGVRGEYLVPIGSLPGTDGVALFIERAVAVRPDLDADANRAVIERLCARLDGIPLAIELAAARCRSLTPGEIDDLLDDRFRLLRGGRQGAERHRTLQAAVAWSYEMLDSAERAVFDQMAVFAGGTLIDGLVAVTGMDRFDVVDVVDRLVARSMVVATATPLGTRYHQLETLRQYAEDRLVEAGDIERVRTQHLAWVHQLAAWIASCSGTPRAGEAFRRFCIEVDNLRAAVAHATGTGRHHSAHEIVAAVAETARYRPVFEVVDWVRPIQLDGDWTDAAAECASFGGVFDLLRSRVDANSVVIPDRLVQTNPVVAVNHLFQQAAMGNMHSALEQLTRIGTPTDGPHLATDVLWLWIQFMLQFRSDVGQAATIDFDEIRRHGHAALAAAQASGDELVHGRVATYLALALEFECPDEAIALAFEAIEVLDRRGAVYMRDIADATRYRCIARMTSRTTSNSAPTVRSLHDAIAAAIQAGSPATMLSMAALPWVAEVDLDCAYTLVAVSTRAQPAWLDWLTQFGLPVPANWAEWEQRTQHLSIDDATRGVLATLGRWLVAAEAPSAAGGEN